MFHAYAGSGILESAESPPREMAIAKDLVPAHVKPRQVRSITRIIMAIFSLIVVCCRLVLYCYLLFLDGTFMLV